MIIAILIFLALSAYGSAAAMIARLLTQWGRELGDNRDQWGGEGAYRDACAAVAIFWIVCWPWVVFKRYPDVQAFRDKKRKAEEDELLKKEGIYQQ